MSAVKLCGVLLVILSCSTAGFLKSRCVLLRVKKLSLFCDGLDQLFEYVQQGNCELKTALKTAFLKCEFLSFQNTNVLCCDNDLNSDDKALINDFFSLLGASPKKAECDRISNFKLKMRTHLKDAESDMSQKSKIYQTFGICIGLALGILLI